MAGLKQVTGLTRILLDQQEFCWTNKNCTVPTRIVLDQQELYMFTLNKTSIYIFKNRQFMSSMKEGDNKKSVIIYSAKQEEFFVSCHVPMETEDINTLRKTDMSSSQCSPSPQVVIEGPDLLNKQFACS